MESRNLITNLAVVGAGVILLGSLAGYFIPLYSSLRKRIEILERPPKVVFYDLYGGRYTQVIRGDGREFVFDTTAEGEVGTLVDKSMEAVEEENFRGR